MGNGYERGKALLDALGTPTKRPEKPPRWPSNGPCARCGAYCVVWSDMPSGARVPLDVHPEGPIVIRDGVAREVEATEGERRYCLHFKSCKEKQEASK